MTDIQQANNSRRSFFIKGSAALGAGLASTTAAASTLVFNNDLPLQDQLSTLQQQLATLEDHEEIRQLHLAFTALIENRDYYSIPALFSADSSVNLHGEEFFGRQTGITQLFTEKYTQQDAPSLHMGFRQDQSQAKDELSINADQSSARAVFHNRVHIGTPVNGDTVLAKMARLQGQSENSHWESGKFELSFVKENETWKIKTLQYQAIS